MSVGVQFPVPPGFPCPRCHTKIRVTLDELMLRSHVSCVGCGLELHVDRQRSQDTLEGAARHQDRIRQVGAGKGG